MQEILESSFHDKRIMLLQVTNAGFTAIIITADNKQRIVQQYFLKFISWFHRKDLDFGLFHSPTVCFYQTLPETERFNCALLTEISLSISDKMTYASVLLLLAFDFPSKCWPNSSTIELAERALIGIDCISSTTGIPSLAIICFYKEFIHPERTRLWIAFDEVKSFASIAVCSLPSSINSPWATEKIWHPVGLLDGAIHLLSKQFLLREKSFCALDMPSHWTAVLYLFPLTRQHRLEL
jgi:hypothetical protein